MIAVFNSSPLIFLSRLNIINQVLGLFSEVVIPDYVKKEIFRKEDIVSDKVKDLLRLNNVVEVGAKNLRMVDAFCRKLGKGESEAIVVAIERSADLVILDDHVAREEATRVGLNVKGTLGDIRKLMELDVIQCDPDKLHRDLLEMKFRVKRGIFDEIFADGM
jgi:predicted nucleic acid-binding protein